MEQISKEQMKRYRDESDAEVYIKWENNTDIIKKIFKNNILTKEESNKLVDIYQGYIGGFFVGNIEKGFELGDKLREEIR